MLDSGRPAAVFYSVVAAVALTIATVLNLPRQGVRPAPQSL
jgi:hypothetical protein